MLKAARVHGRPIIVMAMISAAISQPTAIIRPPQTIQRTLSRSDIGDIGALPCDMWEAAGAPASRAAFHDNVQGAGLSGRGSRSFRNRPECAHQGAFEL